MDDDFFGEKRFETFSRKRVTVARVPFVGAIVGPYRGPRGDPDPDPDPDPVAEMTWFHVDADAGDGVLRDAGLAGQPKEVRVDRECLSKNDDGVFDRLRRDAFALADVFGSGAERFDRVDLYKPWGSRSIATDESGHTMRGEPATRLTKILRSLRSRVRDAATAEATDAFVDAVAEKTKRAWRGDAIP